MLGAGLEDSSSGELGPEFECLRAELRSWCLGARLEDSLVGELGPGLGWPESWAQVLVSWS